MLTAAVLATVLSSTSFTPVHLTRSYTQRIAAPASVVFPLMGPSGERKWAGPTWSPDFLFPRDARDQAGAVFRTSHGGRETIWTLTVFDEKTLRVEYVQVSPGHHVAQLAVQLAPDGDARTRAEITYTWTGLSATGNAFIERHRGAHFDESMSVWEKELNDYLSAAASKR